MSQLHPHPIRDVQLDALRDELAQARHTEIALRAQIKEQQGQLDAERMNCHALRMEMRRLRENKIDTERIMSHG